MLNPESSLSLKERRRRRLIFKMAAKSFCPKCRSENVTMDGASIEFSGGAMLCKDCGNRETIFPTKKLTKKNKKSKK